MWPCPRFYKRGPFPFFQLSTLLFNGLSLTALTNNRVLIISIVAYDLSSPGNTSNFLARARTAPDGYAPLNSFLTSPWCWKLSSTIFSFGIWPVKRLESV